MSKRKGKGKKYPCPKCYDSFRLNAREVLRTHSLGFGEMCPGAGTPKSELVKQ